MIVKYADEMPRCPTQMHFGEHDEHIPMKDVEAIKAFESRHQQSQPWLFGAIK